MNPKAEVDMTQSNADALIAMPKVCAANVPLPELKTAHQELMTRYVAVLDEVTRASRLMPRKEAVPQVYQWQWPKYLPLCLDKYRDKLMMPRSNPPLRVFPGPRFLVRLFVEWHIYSQVKALAKAFLYLRIQAAPDAKEMREWAKESGELCDKMAGTLTSWTNIEGLVKLLWPVAAGGLVAWLGVKTFWEALKIIDWHVYIVIYGVSVFPTLYFVAVIQGAFGCKREMFIPGFDYQERPLVSDCPPSNSNIYLLEDHLFGLLGWVKTREQQWDIYLSAFAFLMLGSLPVWVYLYSPKEPPDLFFSIIGTSFFVIGLLMPIFMPIKRQWQ